MPKKKVPQGFWTQYEDGRKWFANLGPIRLCVIDPKDLDNPEKAAFVVFNAHADFNCEGEWTIEDAKQKAVDLAKDLLNSAQEELNKIPEL